MTSTTLTLPSFDECLQVISALDESEWKPCVSLVRYGVIPHPEHTTLWGKLPESLIQKFFHTPRSDGHYLLNPNGRIFFSVATRPLLSSMLISMILSRIPSDEYISNAIVTSVSKEISVMESHPRSSTIDWDIIFNPHKRFHKLADECDANPIIHNTIYTGLVRLRNNMDMKLLWPYSTRRGISSETAREYYAATIGLEKPWFRPELIDKGVTSTDVVSLYLHHGIWVGGDCELKQKWYPSGLTPRTYFSQGGKAIRVSCYLRDFFNDVCDTFLPTNRYARIDGSRLITYKDGYFFIYDLTSFTSNFHEQRHFLEALSSFFSGTPVFRLDHGLEVSLDDLGEMIALYTDEINTNPRYILSPRLFDLSEKGSLRLTHHVAGFLGVPGNLATCTFPHGVLIAQHTDNTDRQSCAGDDGNIACISPMHQSRIESSIKRLGIFQQEKGSTTRFPEAASYLKRRFIQEGNCGALINRVEYLILSSVNAFHKPDPRFEQLSQDRSRLRESVAHSVASLIRSLYAYTNGTYLEGELDLVLGFLKYVYETVELPKGGELRGMLLDDADRRNSVAGSIVFPLEERFLKDDPDLLFAEMFTPWVVVVPETTDREIFDFEGDWHSGEVRSCRLNSTLEKLVKFGWIKREQTPKRVLIGPDARRYFRRLLRDEISALQYEYTASFLLSERTLQEIGIYEYQLGSITRPSKRRKFHHNVYFDEDDPVVLSMRGRDQDRATGDTVGITTGALDEIVLDY